MTTEEMTELMRLMQAARPEVHQTLNFNGPIGQQIAHVDRIEAHFDKDMTMQVLADGAAAGPADGAEQTPKSVPAELTTPEAADLLERLQRAGFLDEEFQPLNLSRAKTAILAHFIADTLSIKNMWTLFGEWWNMNAMSAAYNSGMQQKGTAEFLVDLGKV